MEEAARDAQVPNGSSSAESPGTDGQVSEVGKADGSDAQSETTVGFTQLDDAAAAAAAVEVGAGSDAFVKELEAQESTFSAVGAEGLAADLAAASLDAPPEDEPQPRDSEAQPRESEAQLPKITAAARMRTRTEAPGHKAPKTRRASVSVVVVGVSYPPDLLIVFPKAGMVPSFPEGVDPTRREAYLDEDAFEKIIGMPRAEFQALPKWKQVVKKKEAGLF